MKQMIEMEIGITGGEEDGVNNEDVDNASMYTQPEDIWAIYKELSEVSDLFSIAAGFGNVHGVYKPGNVKLRPELLLRYEPRDILFAEQSFNYVQPSGVRRQQDQRRQG
jgi:fructose-bisphosphate aldolase class II